jgi:Icc-related predicted phosphoesterase
MKSVIKSIILTLLLIVPTASIVSLEYIAYMNDDDNNGPWVTFFENKVCVSWERENVHSGIVKYGLDANNLSSEKTTDNPAKIQHVILEGLPANSTFFYEVYIEAIKIGQGSFRTSSGLREDFSFVVIADTQQSKITVGGYPKIAREIAKGDYRFVAIVGDFAEKGTNKAHYNNFFRNSEQYLHKTALIPVLGNHDNHDQGPWFKQYFKNNDGRTQFCYSFNYNSIHFTILQFTYAYEYEFSEEQMNFIREDLSNAQNASYRIVMFHCPVLGAGFYNYNQRLIQRLVPILKENNVTAVFSGHEHHYERSIYGNLTYFVVGTGGGIQDPGLTPLPESQIVSALPCYTVVSLNQTGLYFKTLTSYGKIIDEAKLG